jgi:SRSO17 transposase
MSRPVWTRMHGSVGGRRLFGLALSRFTTVRLQTAHRRVNHDLLPPRQRSLARCPHKEKEPAEFWFCSLPDQAGLRRLARLAKIKWLVEQNYRQKKHELGLDHYERRGYRALHNHVTVNMVAYGFLLLETLRNKKLLGLPCRRSAR